MTKPALVALDVVAWLAIHVVVGYAAHRWPSRAFARDGPITRLRAWERDGRTWQRLLRVRTWKRWLPEAGAVFAGGFDKRRLPGRDAAALSRYVAETRRAELSHWTVMATAPVFALWNPWYASVAMLVYGVVVNGPCILSQRFNRARLLVILSRRAARASPLPRPPEGG